MKRLVLVAAAVCAVCAFAQDVIGGSAQMSDRAKAKLKARQIIYERLGGEIKKPDKTPAFLFLDCQSRVDASAIEPAARNIRMEFGISVITRQGKYADLGGLLKTAVVTNDHVATVAIVDVEGLPRLTAMPDDCAAIVNVRALAVDKPSGAMLAERTTKMAYRAFMIAMGAAWTAQGMGLMRPAETLRDLDLLWGRASPPDCHFPVATQIRRKNVAEGGYTTYQDACLDGWAPAPTNDVQKRIWDGVKSGAIKD